MSDKVVLMDIFLAEKVADIEVASFSEPWSLAQLTETLEDEKYRFYCLTDEGSQSVLSYIGVLVVCGEGEIVSVATDRPHRGKGYADRLLKYVTEKEKELGTERLVLEVRVSNAGAVRLYEKNGFAGDCVRKDFYRMPVEDALLMSKRLV